jgi:hypothetical protein
MVLCDAERDGRWHVWAPLSGCTPLNSLQVFSGSHRMDVPNEIVRIHLGARPSINEKWLRDHDRDFFCPFARLDGSECIVFDDKLVHRGPPNNATPARISCEFTVLIQR